MDRYRIEDVRTVRLNGGDDVTMFKAYELDPTGTCYYYIGHFTAPYGTTRDELENYIREGIENEEDN